MQGLTIDLFSQLFPWSLSGAIVALVLPRGLVTLKKKSEELRDELPISFFAVCVTSDDSYCRKI